MFILAFIMLIASFFVGLYVNVIVGIIMGVVSIIIMIAYTLSREKADKEQAEAKKIEDLENEVKELKEKLKQEGE